MPESAREGRPTVVGYDGSTFTVGDRVELHPSTDTWMQGARFGTVAHITQATTSRKFRCRVTLDASPDRRCVLNAYNLRRA